MIKRILSLAICLSICLISACDKSLETKSCTLIGCEDGLTLSFKGQLPSTFQLKLKSKEGKMVEGECPAKGAQDFSCFPDSVFISRFTADEIEVTFNTSDKELQITVKPSYEKRQPNGAGCDPICNQGKAEIDLSALKLKI